MAIHFEIRRNSRQQLYVHLLDDSGAMLLMSAEYESRDDLDQCISDLRVATLMGHQIGAGRVADGSVFFVIRDEHGAVIAKSALYQDQMAFDNALHQVKDNTCVAEINDLSEAA